LRSECVVFYKASDACKYIYIVEHVRSQWHVCTYSLIWCMISSYVILCHLMLSHIISYIKKSTISNRCWQLLIIITIIVQPSSQCWWPNHLQENYQKKTETCKTTYLIFDTYIHVLSLFLFLTLPLMLLLTLLLTFFLFLFSIFYFSFNVC
jgi:hypothetical protein